MISNGSNALLSHPSGIYLGTYVDGLHRSMDGGLTWQPVGGGFPASGDVEALAASGSAIFVAGGSFGAGRIYASLDDGQTWSALATNPNLSSLSLLATGNTVLAGCNGGGGIQRSPDLGATWSPVRGDPGERGRLQSRCRRGDPLCRPARGRQRRPQRHLSIHERRPVVDQGERRSARHRRARHPRHHRA